MPGPYLDPTDPDLITIWLGRDWQLSYSLGTDLTGATIYSNLCEYLGGPAIASFTVVILTTGVPSRYTRSLSAAAMASAGIYARQYVTDQQVSFSGGPKQSLTEPGWATVKGVATLVP
jgi:hypothetical protein